MNFDDFYSGKENYYSLQHSIGMEECMTKFSIKACSAVDIGAGEGRNSVYLSALGFDVIAIEPSKVGAAKIVKNAQEKDLRIKVMNTDFLSASKNLSDIGFIVAVTSLEHMDYEYLCEAVKQIKRIMKPEGYVYILVFTEDDPGFIKDVKNTSECSIFIKHYFKKGELRNFFSDFEILEYSEYTKEDTTHGPVHYHGKAKLFARKPL